MITGIETERADLFDVSILIAMRISIKGKITEDDLKAAFDKAVKSYEILNSHVVIEADGGAYYESNSEDSPGRNSLTFEDNFWMDIIKREEKKRFRLEEGELLKAFCYEQSEEGCSILFLLHHLGGDGKSLCYFIETFMRILAGEEPEYRELITIPAGDLSDEALKDRVGPLAAVPKIYNKRWKEDKECRLFDFEDMDAAYEEYWKDRESDIKEIVIPVETVVKILKRCKEWGIGFTAYITTAFLRRMGRKLDIGYAVDAREDQNRCMGNQATGISIKYAYDYNKPFKKNALKVQKLMDSKLEDDGARMFILPFMSAFEPGLRDALNLEHAGTFHSKTSGKLAKLLGYGEKTKDLSITNLTRLDIPIVYGDYELEFFSFIPPVISYGKNIIGLSTLGDVTVMTIHRVKKLS